MTLITQLLSNFHETTELLRIMRKTLLAPKMLNSLTSILRKFQSNFLQ